MSLSQKYEERVRKFSFLARHHFRAELGRYIYIIIFDKHLSELYWFLLMCFYNHGNNIVRLFDALLNFAFTTSETKRDYY